MFKTLFGVGASATRSPDEAHLPSDWVRWSTVGVLLIMAIVAYLDRQILSLLVGPIRADLNISDMQIGLLQGLAFAILYCVAGLPLGWAVDRVERRSVIFFGVFVWSLATLAAGLAETYNHLLWARIFVGMGEAALAPAAYSMISDMFAKRQLAFVLSVYMIGQQLGASIALMVGGATITYAADGIVFPIVGHLNVWQATFFLCGAPGLLLAFLIFLVPEPKRRVSAGESGSWAELLDFMNARRAFFIYHIGGFAVAMTLAYASIFWAPVVLSRTYGWSPAQIGMFYGTFSASVGILGLLVNGRVVDTLLARGINDAHMRYYVWATLVTVVVAGLLLLAPNGWFFLLALAPAKLLFQFTGVSAAALQIVTPATLRGRVSAVYLLVISLVGITAGPASVAFFTDYVFRDDAQVATSLSAAFAVLAPVGAFLFWRGLKPMREAVVAAGLADATR